MRKSVFSSILAVLCLASVGLVAVGCGCGEDEFNPEDTCEKVTAALNRAITGCNQTTLLNSDEVCGGPCRGGSLYCSSRVDVDACVAALEGIACGDTHLRAIYASVPACVEVFDNLDIACTTSSSNIDSDDD
jgi:hypothetical protein